MKNYQKYNFANIETNNFIAFCNVYNNRSGFVHECRLEPKSAIKLKNGSFLTATTAKCQYYNRTWESYEFESVILKACEYLPKKEREQAKEEFKNYGQKENAKLDQKLKAFQDAFAGLTESQKKSLSGVTVENKAEFESVCMATQMMALLNKQRVFGGLKNENFDSIFKNN